MYDVNICKYPQIDKYNSVCWLGSEFIAKRDDVESMIKLRNLNEVHEGYKTKLSFELPSTLIEQNRIEDGLHAAIFLCFIGLKADAITLDETLGDFGLVHELSHYISNTHQNDDRSEERENLINLAKQVESKTTHLFNSN